MDAVCALDACVMVKADNESVGRDIRERELSDRAVKRDRLSVADAPIVRALSRVGKRTLITLHSFYYFERRAHEKRASASRRSCRETTFLTEPLVAARFFCRRDRVRPPVSVTVKLRPVARLVAMSSRPFQRDGRAGVYVDGNRRGKERQRHRVAILRRRRFSCRTFAR